MHGVEPPPLRPWLASRPVMREKIDHDTVTGSEMINCKVSLVCVVMVVMP